MFTNLKEIAKDHPVTVIYHGLCCDGYSAAWCFHDFFKGKINITFHEGVYKRPPPDVTGQVVFIVDFSYKRPIMEELCEQAHYLIWIDHHKSAMEEMEGFEHEAFVSYTDLNRSGATLAWDFLHDGRRDNMPLLLNHIEDRDLWRFKLEGTREIQANVFSYGYDFERWDRLMSANQTDLLKMTVAGAGIERKHQKDVNELVGFCKRYMSIGGYPVPVASLPYTMVSDAAQLMAEGEAFAACYWDTPTGRTFGLRSTEGVGMDVSLIALSYGGGGHKHSSGFSVPRDHELAMS